MQLASFGQRRRPWPPATTLWMAAEAEAASDPYAAPLVVMRGASETRLSAFERRWKEKRLAALKAEHARLMGEHQ